MQSRLHEAEKRVAVLFILLGMLGSFPLIITLEQSGFYLATSYPYYAIGFAVLFSSLLAVFEPAHWESWIQMASSAVTLIAIIATLAVYAMTIDMPRRDAEKKHESGSSRRNSRGGANSRVAKRVE